MEYVPVLKGKQAEISAALTAPMSLDLTPLFEIQQAPKAAVDKATGVAKKQKSAPTDAAYFLDEVARLWSGPLYVDVSRVATAPVERTLWWRLLALLNNMAAVPVDLVPVVSLHDDTTSRTEAGTLAIVGRAALRLPMALVRTNPTVLNGLVASVASDMGLQSDKVDVIFDWSNELEASTLDSLEADTLAAIGAVGGTHGKLVVVGTPNDAAFTQVGDWAPVRREWWLWLRLAHAGVDVVYGDYALYSPSDPVPARALYGHLRYSSDDKMHVHRRAMPKSGGGLGAAFEECCAHVLGETHWLGASFSKADQRIADIAVQADKAAQAGVWRQIAVEHHFALVDSLLKSPPAAPAAGTP
ncbi:beta family protein [Pimelobacter simplex]|uniref:beta family protein n=1 Tax=Nocardioides simplex TaxID=2045 RepID=UPI003AAC99C0